MTLINKICGRCAYYDSNNPHCIITNQQVDKSNSCGNYNSNPEKCAICGRFIVDNVIFDPAPKGGYYPICMNCFKSLGTCPTCNNAQTCLFEQSPIQIPKVVNQQVRQGGMIMQTQVRNPARVDATCKKGCACWNGTNCCRDNNGCDKYNHTY